MDDKPNALDDELDRIIVAIIALGVGRVDRKKAIADLKSTIYSLLESGLPENKERDYDEIKAIFVDLPETLPDYFDAGYDQALRDVEATLRKVLK